MEVPKGQPATMLLFLTQAEDMHADWVEAECDRRAVPYLRLCTEEFPTTMHLSLHVEAGGIEGTIRLPEREVPLSEVIGIWFRRPGDVTPHPDMDPEYERFFRMEANATLDNLYHTLSERRWVNHPREMAAANHKLRQLRVAHQLGFKTMPTLVTNDPQEVRAFFHACGGQMVYKTMRQVPIAYIDDTAYGIYTTLITQEALDDHLDTIHFIPCLFQKFIPKEYELRINVIGEHVWAAAIYSQESEEAMLDFRPHTSAVRHAPVLLPREVEEACRRLTHRLGLRMGNIDLILTPDGDYYFLEINPGGQWAWVEDRVGFPLSTALVDELLGIDTLADHPYLRDRSLLFEPNTAIKQRPTEFP